MRLTRRTALQCFVAGAVTPRVLRAGEIAEASDVVGRVNCGYQGWFRTPGDGTNLGWYHYGTHGKFKPGACGIDLWPDVSELGEGQTEATEFRHADGSVARVFSSHHPKTIDLHFKWMADYGIDGVFMQRFSTLIGSRFEASFTDILGWAGEAAGRHGRKLAVMYDLTGLREGQIDRVIDDWKKLQQMPGLIQRDRYMHHGGRPVVSIWGVGFSDDRRYTLAECRRLVHFLKSEAGGRCCVKLGVPFWWRQLKDDAVDDPTLHEIIAMADIVSPWSVGRYRNFEHIDTWVRQQWADDAAWCAERGVVYLPVAFAGFSWHNLMKARGHEAELNYIPRQGGRFLWRQFVTAREVGIRSMYIAMFDEMDEATAIFKCTNNPPVGESPFVTYDSLPSDHYLWLTGQGARLLRGEIEPTMQLPARGEQ
ncbi:xylosidase/arabinosidase [Planctomycetales bacterium ZRK34]|nr:xylosidase/arabinosidase [Planctomycetales bacterium ZRK34]